MTHGRICFTRHKNGNRRSWHYSDFRLSGCICWIVSADAGDYLIGAGFQASAKKKEAAAAAATPEPVSTPEPEEPQKPVAPGSAGHVKRFDVSDKEAAMVMAVVAYQMKKPLNELRFLSIKEVKNDEV